MGTRFQCIEVETSAQQKRIEGFEATNHLRLSSLETQLKALDEFAHRPNDYYEKIEEMEDRVRKNVADEMKKMIQSVNKMVYEQDAICQETKFFLGKIDAIQQSHMADLKRHEQLCFELATKFDQQHEILMQFSEQVESFKTYALVNDLHMETYLPMQMASLAYQVGQGLTKRDNASKYEKHFIKTILKQLKKNMMDVCDPKLEVMQSAYSKMNYQLPGDIGRDKKGNATAAFDEIHTKVLQKMSLGNIHLQHDQSKGKAKLSKGNSLTLAEKIVRGKLGLSKELLLTGRNGPLTRQALTAPLQKTLETVQRSNFEQLKVQLKAARLMPFHLEKMTMIKELLDYSRIKKEVLGVPRLDEPDLALESENQDIFNEVQNEQRLQVQKQESNSESEEEESEDEEREKQQLKSNKQEEKQPQEQQVEKVPDEKVLAEKVLDEKVPDENKKPVMESKLEQEVAVQEEQFNPNPVYNPDHLAQASQRAIRSGCSVEQVFTICAQVHNYREPLDEMQVLLEAKIGIVEEALLANKNEVILERKAMHKALKEEINVRECEQRQLLLDKIQSVFEESNERMDLETDVLQKRIKQLENLVKEHDQQIQIELMGKDETSLSESSSSEETVTVTESSKSLNPAAKSSSTTQDCVTKNPDAVGGFGLSFKAPNQDIKIEKERSFNNTKQVVNLMRESEGIVSTELGEEPQHHVTNNRYDHRNSSTLTYYGQQKQEKNVIIKVAATENIKKLVKAQAKCKTQKNSPLKQQDEVPRENSPQLSRFAKSDFYEPIDNQKIGIQSPITLDLISPALKIPVTGNQVTKVDPKKTVRKTIVKTRAQQDKKMEKLAEKAVVNHKYQKVMAKEVKGGNVKRQIKRAQFQQVKTITDNDQIIQKLLMEQQEKNMLEIKRLKMNEQIAKLKQLKTENDRVVLLNPREQFEKNKKKDKSSKSPKQPSRKNSKNIKKSVGKEETSSSKDSSKEGSGDSDSDEESDEDLKDYLKIVDFEDFKEQVYQLMSFKEQDIVQLRAEQSAFLGENLRLLEKLDKIDWGVMRKAEAMTTSTLAEFRKVVNAFEDSIKGDFRTWRHKNQDLQSKYESITLWVKMMSQVNSQIQEEFFNSESEIRKTQELIAEYIKMQIAKDFQDEADKESYSLFGVRQLGPGPDDESEPMVTSVQLDRNCLNCAGTTTREKQNILNCFKLACLNYKAQPVPMPNGETLARNQVTNLQSLKLQRIQQDLTHQNHKIVQVQEYLEKLRDSTLKQFEKGRCKEPRFIQHEIVKDWKNIITKPSYQNLADFKKRFLNDRMFDADGTLSESPEQSPDNLEKHLQSQVITDLRRKVVTAQTKQKPTSRPERNWATHLLSAQTSEAESLRQTHDLNRRSLATLHQQQLTLETKDQRKSVQVRANKTVNNSGVLDAWKFNTTSRPISRESVNLIIGSPREAPSLQLLHRNMNQTIDLPSRPELLQKSGILTPQTLQMANQAMKGQSFSNITSSTKPFSQDKNVTFNDKVKLKRKK